MADRRSSRQFNVSSPVDSMPRFRVRTIVLPMIPRGTKKRSSIYCWRNEERLRLVESMRLFTVNSVIQIVIFVAVARCLLILLGVIFPGPGQGAISRS